MKTGREECLEPGVLQPGEPTRERTGMVVKAVIVAEPLAEKPMACKWFGDDWV